MLMLVAEKKVVEMVVMVNYCPILMMMRSLLTRR